MAEFLSTRGISYHIEQIIKGAKTKLYLISPYLQLPPDLFERLKETEQRKIKTTLVYGKEELKSDQASLLSELSNLELRFCENLHAKCYFNESNMVITSMNLHQYSEKNNREMGVLISKDKDPKLFDEAVAEAVSILEHSREVQIAGTEVSAALDSPSASQQQIKCYQGFCIRCSRGIALNPDAPYCKECYHVWAEFQNESYEEKYCLKCGNSEPTSMNRPLCHRCYQAI